MRILIAAAALTLAACNQPQAEIAAAPVENVAPPASLSPSAGIDGWEIDQTAYAKINTPLPAFTAQKDDSDITAETLRGRWTILGIVNGPITPEETNFLAALASAADQDSDLDVLMIDPHPGTTTWPDGTTTMSGWPVASNGVGLAESLALPATPAYLLIGPDLTIEGYRGALSLTPDDGIKSVIRGVAEIRKQIAAPQ